MEGTKKMKKKIIINMESHNEQQEQECLILSIKAVLDGKLTAEGTKKENGEHYGYFVQVAKIPDVDKPLEPADFIGKLSGNNVIEKTPHEEDAMLVDFFNKQEKEKPSSKSAAGEKQ